VNERIWSCFGSTYNFTRYSSLGKLGIIRSNYRWVRRNTIFESRSSHPRTTRSLSPTVPVPVRRSPDIPCVGRLATQTHPRSFTAPGRFYYSSPCQQMRLKETTKGRYAPIIIVHFPLPEVCWLPLTWRPCFRTSQPKKGKIEIQIIKLINECTFMRTYL
jgi:hypothetical protein